MKGDQIRSSSSPKNTYFDSEIIDSLLRFRSGVNSERMRFQEIPRKKLMIAKRACVEKGLIWRAQVRF
jgi:hypothetical protein